MSGNRILALGEENDVYWIAANPLSPQHSDGRLTLGRDCRSVSELELVADEIKAELDALLAEARQRLDRAPNPAPTGFQSIVTQQRPR